MIQLIILLSRKEFYPPNLPDWCNLVYWIEITIYKSSCHECNETWFFFLPWIGNVSAGLSPALIWAVNTNVEMNLVFFKRHWPIWTPMCRPTRIRLDANAKYKRANIEGIDLLVNQWHDNDNSIRTRTHEKKEDSFELKIYGKSTFQRSTWRREVDFT